MTSSYYIDQIERKQAKLGINPDLDLEYNLCFEEENQARFIRKLSIHNERLNKMIDDKEMD